MDAAAFVAQLEDKHQHLLSALGQTDLLEGDGGPELSVPRLLKMALKNELEASELAARWIATTPEVEVKLYLASQAGDEARHYKLIEQRLRELEVDLSSFHPLAEGYGPLFQFLLTLESTVERVAAGPFTREALAVHKNARFIELCLARGDVETARLYQDRIQKDERWHHEAGRALLVGLIHSEEDAQRAERACEKVLSLAEELQGRVKARLGLVCTPGC